MICAKCGWECHTDRAWYKHVCPQSMASFTEDAPRVDGWMLPVVPRCPECERLRTELKKWTDAAIDACAKVGSLRALCREAAEWFELFTDMANASKQGNPEAPITVLGKRLRKAGGET